MPERLTLATHEHGRDHAAWLAQFPAPGARHLPPPGRGAGRGPPARRAARRRGRRSPPATRRRDPGSGLLPLAEHRPAHPRARRAVRAPHQPQPEPRHRGRAGGAAAGACRGRRALGRRQHRVRAGAPRNRRHVLARRSRRAGHQQPESRPAAACSTWACPNASSPRAQYGNSTRSRRASCIRTASTTTRWARSSPASDVVFDEVDDFRVEGPAAPHGAAARQAAAHGHQPRRHRARSTSNAGTPRTMASSPSTASSTGCPCRT